MYRYQKKISVNSRIKKKSHCLSCHNIKGRRKKRNNNNKTTRSFRKNHWSTFSRCNIFPLTCEEDEVRRKFPSVSCTRTQPPSKPVVPSQQLVPRIRKFDTESVKKEDNGFGRPLEIFISIYIHSQNNGIGKLLQIFASIYIHRQTYLAQANKKCSMLVLF